MTLAIILVLVGIGFAALGTQGIRQWYREQAAGNPTPPYNWKMLVGPFVATIALLVGLSLLFL